MTDEKSLRKFVIKKFIATIIIVGIVEYFLLLFINNIMFPLATAAFFPELENLKVLSIGNVVFLIILLILYAVSLIMYRIVPASSGFVVNFTSEALKFYGIGTTESTIANMSVQSSVALVMTVTAVLILVILPFATGAVVFSGQVTREIRKFEDARNMERMENERKRYLMISDIAHDLKTPMTTVSGYARALSDGIVKGDQQKEYLEAITDKTERMNDIIQMLFNYVRLDSEGFALVKNDIDVCELVRECIGEYYQDVEDAGDEMDIDIPESRVMISADKIQLGRVIGNLLSNAVRHNDKGTHIGVTVRQDEDEIRIYVADSGKMIEGNFAKDIFEPFVMGDSSRSSGGGSGLGLSVAKKIVEMHGFKIKLVQSPEIARYRLGEEYNKVFVIIIR